MVKEANVRIYIFILSLRDLRCAADQGRMMYLVLFGILTTVNTKEPVSQILHFTIKKTYTTE